jgi:NADH dehydrogenase/NADH:ubiquinone oxidoreductase subunit G
MSSDPFKGVDADDRVKILTGTPTLIRLGTRRTPLYEKATVSLPVCTWAEKSGVYENFEGRIQAFEQAIAPMEDTRSAGRIFWDLLGNKTMYTAAAAREQMAAAGMAEYAGVEVPRGEVKIEEMQFSDL